MTDPATIVLGENERGESGVDFIIIFSPPKKPKKVIGMKLFR